MKNHIKSLLFGLCAAALALGCAGCGGSAGSEVPAKVTDITVWTYYNGDQLESFTKLVDEFNSTVGAEKGISVSTESLGSVNDLEASVMDAAEGKVGASELPKIFSAYADTAYAMDQILSGAVQTVKTDRLYTPSAFEGGASARKVLEYGLSDLAAADRETVAEHIAAGQSAADAEAEFLTDDYFENWYQDICSRLKRYEG